MGVNAEVTDVVLEALAGTDEVERVVGVVVLVKGAVVDVTELGNGVAMVVLNDTLNVGEAVVVWLSNDEDVVFWNSGAEVVITAVSLVSSVERLLVICSLDCSTVETWLGLPVDSSELISVATLDGFWRELVVEGRRLV